MVFDRGLDRQPRTAWRYRFEKKPVDVATVNQIHQHFAVIAASCNDGNQSRFFIAQLVCQGFDLRTDHGGVCDQDTNIFIAREIFCLGRRKRMMQVMQSAR